MTEFFQIMLLPFWACVVLTGIHAYLGFHVMERQVIFVDLALAQVAVLGASVALVFGFALDSATAYWISLIFTIIAAALLSFMRSFAFKPLGQQSISQEAMIGIVYAVSAALLVIVLSHSAEGDEQIKQALVGNILLVNLSEIMKMAVVYLVVGSVFYIFRQPFLMISRDPLKAAQSGIKIRYWDFLFYVLFGIVVTSSVKIAGVLLVFAYLVVPAVSAMLFSNDFLMRLLIGWGVSLLASIIGLVVSYHFDFPTGATIICALGFILLFLFCLPRR